MTTIEAKELLKHHSLTHKDMNHPKSEDGFLGMLRPFNGKLIEKNFHEVREAIVTLAKELSANEEIDRDVISAIWSICHLTRFWSIEPDSMLQRNNLISQEQIEILRNWIGAISFNTMLILDGNSDEATLRDFEKI